MTEEAIPGQGILARGLQKDFGEFMNIQYILSEIIMDIGSFRGRGP